VGTKLIYVDDSGASETGFATYSFCIVVIVDWSRALAVWLQWRAHLSATKQIPKAVELHATKFVNGRGDPSLDPSWNRRKANRHRVVDDVKALLADQEWLTLGTVYSRTGARGRDFARERERVYLELIRTLDRLLASQGDHGIVVMDGDGSDDSYITAHRQLDLVTRALIEDPGFQHSHRSQWIQMADLVPTPATSTCCNIPASASRGAGI
jgi:hypothetical protein